MSMVKRLIGCVLSMTAIAATAFALQPPPQTEFVPMNSLPPADQLPAAPLLIAAYAFVWIALAVYLWSIWSRLGKVERDMQALRQRTGRTQAR
jgi:CcmD family protein